MFQKAYLLISPLKIIPVVFLEKPSQVEGMKVSEIEFEPRTPPTWTPGHGISQGVLGFDRENPIRHKEFTSEKECDDAKFMSKGLFNLYRSWDEYDIVRREHPDMGNDVIEVITF